MDPAFKCLQRLKTCGVEDDASGLATIEEVEEPKETIGKGGSLNTLISENSTKSEPTKSDRTFGVDIEKTVTM